MESNQISTDDFKHALKSQYHAAFNMLGEAIEKCPDELWDNHEFKNRFWQLSYHTLFFTHLYLCKSNEDFIPWIKHQENNQNPDGMGGDPDPESKLPLIPDPYTREEVLEYWGYCKGIVDEFVDIMDLSDPESGFSWYPISKLEHQLVNIRHLQHGAAQLADRLRLKENIGIRWSGRGKKKE
ncbi:MAG TPA: hypothetical protein PKA90_05170 [Ignavibacteria bacterium]|nr:hypothetical protein [Ignavibacteria bacterium]HMR39801.1 hypothetical protein [Ignavibacteria bacterium]